MSNISISGAATGTATFTIESPATSTNRTLTLPDEAGTITTSNSPYSTFRNRIINGDMRIDQRNAGAAVTVNSTTSTFAVDRFLGRAEAADGVFTAQQDTSAPVGFVNSLKATVTTADASIGSTQRYQIQQRIEGTNISDLGWGTANAKTVTLSFWVRSSLTGTFGGSLFNNAGDRSYPFTYSISAADTWEYKTVTIAGDTSGTWLTTTGIGIGVNFSLGAGSSVLGTAGAWAGTLYVGATGQVNLIGTLNATFYITGVQLEVGSVATPFERRPYGTELSLCQRYYQILFSTTDSLMLAARGDGGAGTGCFFSVPLTNSLRASPTVTTGTLSFFDTDSNSTSTTATTVSVWDARNPIISLFNDGFTGTANNRVAVVTPTSSTGIQLNAEL